MLQARVIRVLGGQVTTIIDRRGVASFVACQPATDTLAPFGNAVDGTFGGLKHRQRFVCLGIVLVGFVHGDQTVLDKQFGNEDSLATFDRSGAVHQPVNGSLAGKGVLVSAIVESTLLGHLDTHDTIRVVTERVGIRGGNAGLDVGPVLAGETTEDDFNGGTVVGELIGFRVALEIDELHGVAGRLQDVDNVTRSDAVALAETLQDVDTLGGELENSAFQGEERQSLAIGGFNEAGVEKALTDRTGHFLGHGKGSGGGSGDDARGIFGIRHAIGLGELEGAQVVDGFFGGEGVIIAGEAHAMGFQL